MSRRLSLVLVMVGAVVGSADAQVIGTFRWQLQPYCNVVTVTVTQEQTAYRLEGTDDMCGGGRDLSAVQGLAFPNPDGTIGFGLTIVTAPGGRPVHVDADMTLATLSGGWRDSTGATGTFAFRPGAASGGSPRPVPSGIPSSIALLNDGGLVAEYTGAGAGPIPASGPGTRMLWHPGKAAFRAGFASTSQFDDALIGAFSVAFGSSAVASGNGSVAAGIHTTAADIGAVALGDQTSATARGAFAAGSGSVSQGYASTAFGNSARASGHESVALGWHVRADAGANGAVVLGSNVEAGNLGNGTDVATGAFIFGDRSATNTSAPLLGLTPNEFLMRVAGGVRIYTSASLTSGVAVAPGSGTWSSLSDVRAKEHFRDLDGGDLLEKLERLPIREWNYKTQDAAIRHVGPTAQDFRAAFGLGEDETRISTVDADGIALAAGQALEARTRALMEEVASLRAVVEDLQRQLKARNRRR